MASRALLTIVIFCASVAGVFAQSGVSGDTVPVELSTVGLDGRTGTPIVVRLFENRNDAYLRITLPGSFGQFPNNHFRFGRAIVADQNASRSVRSFLFGSDDTHRAWRFLRELFRNAAEQNAFRT